MTDTEGKQHSDYEVYRRRHRKPRNGDNPLAKLKPAPPNPVKNNKKAKSAIEILDKRAKRSDESPLRFPVKKEKSLADDHKKMKVPDNVPKKSRSKNANNINKQIKQIKKKENTNGKLATLENPKEKRKNIIPHKIIGHHRRDDVEVDLASDEPKSPKTIRVNKVKDWISPHVDSKRPSSSSKKAPTETTPNVKKEKVKKPRTTFKRLIRRPLWQLSKGVIKSNEHWSKLMEENMIDVDKINIDALDLSLIDIDALGIENKLLKRTITWLLK